MLRKICVFLCFILFLGCAHNNVKKIIHQEVEIKIVGIEEKEDGLVFNIVINNQTDKGVLVFKGYSNATADSDPSLMGDFYKEELTISFDKTSCYAPEIPPLNYFLFVPAKTSDSFNYNLEKTVNLPGDKIMYCSVEKEENLSLKKVKMIFQLFNSDNYDEVCGNAKECVKRLGVLNLKKIPRKITVTKELPEALEVFYVPDPAERYLKE